MRRPILILMVLVACAGGTLDRAAFVDQANAICRESQRRVIEALRSPSPIPSASSPSPVPSASAALSVTEQSLDISRYAEASIRALRVATELRDARDRLAGELRAANAASEQAIRALKAGDDADVRHARRLIGAANERFRERARLLSMTDCSG